MSHITADEARAIDVHVGRYEGPHAPMTGRWVCAEDCPHPDHDEGGL